jgi:uncharacterized membrane protein YidH (DUF202 family)
MTLFDPGLQPERTELAWRRTALALGAGSLVAARLLPAVFQHAAWTFVGLSGLVAATVLWVAARRRYRRVIDVLGRDGDRAVLPDASLIVALTSLVSMIGIVALVIGLAAAMHNI